MKPLASRLNAIVLIAALSQGPAALAAGLGYHAHARKTAADKSPLTSQQRALHVLDRLGFGPRPGDVARVEAMGVDAWIDQQLHPDEIDDSALDARLAAYPAMRLNGQQRIEMFPAQPVLRAVENGRLAEPDGAVEHAIYTDQLALLEQRQANKQAGKTGAQPANEDSQVSSMTAREDRLYHDLDAVKIVNLPPPQRLQTLLGMKPDDFFALSRSLTGPERQALLEGLTPVQREEVVALRNPRAVVSDELLATRFLRDVYSERQLQAVMTDFWLNHFNVYDRKGQLAPWYLVEYQNDVIRPRALGKFEDLLVATAESPAMMDYLDNQSSIGPHSVAARRAARNGKQLGINENYGRELMELHTVGVNGGYTQKDVIEVAKAFTGWGVAPPMRGSGFQFNERRHEPGPKYVLGHKINESGQQEGLEVLHILASSPATAHHLSLELAQRFVSDNPPPALVNRMAKTYMKTGGDIGDVLRTLFDSPEFWSEKAYRAKVKTPEEFVISAVRATGGDVVNPAPLLQALNVLGMPLYGCPTPNGYPWTAEAWVNTGDLLNRMNFAMALAGNRAGTAVDLEALTQMPSAATPADKEVQLEKTLLQSELPQQARAAILKQIDTQRLLFMPRTQQAAFTKRTPVMVLDSSKAVPRPQDPQAAMLAGLMLGSPEFQRR